MANKYYNKYTQQIVNEFDIVFHYNFKYSRFSEMNDIYMMIKYMMSESGFWYSSENIRWAINKNNELKL